MPAVLGGEIAVPTVHRLWRFLPSFRPRSHPPQVSVIADLRRVSIRVRRRVAAVDVITYLGVIGVTVSTTSSSLLLTVISPRF